jgi:hypothetical protein
MTYDRMAGSRAYEKQAAEFLCAEQVIVVDKKRNMLLK